MRENNRDTEIWRRTGNQGKNWQLTNIDIGRVDGAFQVKIVYRQSIYSNNVIILFLGGISKVKNKIYTVTSIIFLFSCSQQIRFDYALTITICFSYLQIIIRATRTLSVQGDIAIDDLQFINCNYPGQSNTCNFQLI